MHTSGRGDDALRRHRVSLPGHSYFITICTDQRIDGLNDPAIATVIHKEILAIKADGHWTSRSYVIMPDHLHLFVRISESLPLSRCIARLKSKTKRALQEGGLSWQGNFYEHRLRPDDSIEPVLRYLLLNPYQDNLVPSGETYRWFWLGAEDTEWFKLTTDQGIPFPDWLR